MKVFGIVGHSGMGKTTLLERLLPELNARGMRVSLIKHSHKDIEVDRPGKDSFRLREAGCSEVLLLGQSRWALMHELRGAPEPDLAYLLSRLQACDLVLIEGFKDGDFPKLEVWRAEPDRPPLWPLWPGIQALASDADAATIATVSAAMARHGEAPFADPPLKRPTWLPLADAGAVADFVLAHARPVASID
jgi:molybdopterin-guanine dinucleotide biosynthesis protein B